MDSSLRRNTYRVRGEAQLTQRKGGEKYTD